MISMTAKNGEFLAPTLIMFLAHYIVRVYRFDKKNRSHLAGVVEEVGVKGKKAFTNYDELWDILIASKSTIQKRKSPLCEGKTRRKGGEKGLEWKS
jgi:hypothetical protein